MHTEHAFSSGENRGNEGILSKESNLDIAVKEQVKSLEPAQQEMVKADVKTWKWNRDRIHQIQAILDLGTDEKRSDLINERHKLITENTSLYSHINRALKGTVSTEDELDAFLSRK